MRLLLFPILAFTTIMLGCCSDTILDPYKDSVVITTDQKVLLIDYTGNRCGNCPRAADEAARLHELFGDKLVIVAMHTGSTFARPDPAKGFTEDFRTAAGEGLYTFVGTPGQPAGSVNLVKVTGSYTMLYPNWASAISKELKKTPTMSIAITPQLSNDSVLTVKSVVTYKKASTGNHRLAVYLVEDSVVYAQIDYRLTPEKIDNYTHRHVMRGAIIGGVFTDKYTGVINESAAFGEALPATVANASTSKTYSIPLSGKKWNLKHCSVVVQVLDNTTKSTLQVADTHIQ